MMTKRNLDEQEERFAIHNEEFRVELPVYSSKHLL